MRKKTKRRKNKNLQSELKRLIKEQFDDQNDTKLKEKEKKFYPKNRKIKRAS